jgi:hypothetical protein
MAFKADFLAAVNKAKANMNEVSRKVVLDVGQRLVMRTPVGDRELWAANNPDIRKWRLAHGRPELLPVGYVGGRARANWQHGFNQKPTGEVDETDASGAKTLERIAVKVGDVDMAGVHYIINNVPYIGALENGHSTQAPNGMVGLTAVEFKDIVDVAVIGIKK